MTVGQNIKRLRIRAGLSQEELAQKIGKTRSMISQYESDRYLPRMGTVERLATAFGVKKSEIIEETTYYLANFDSYLTKDEQQLIELYRKMDTRARHDLLSIAASLSPTNHIDEGLSEGIA